MYSDLSACPYFGDGPAQYLIAVGWLSPHQPFARGQTGGLVFAKLKELLKNPWQPVACAGFHKCELCVYEPEAEGKSNLFVPGKGVLYVCPELIVHYMNAHNYCPPAEFCEAVLQCPEMGTQQYRRALLDAGGRPLIKLLRGGTDISLL